jgi:hypothetical protein
MRRDRRIQLVGDGFADEELSVGIFLRPMTFHQLRGQASGSLVLRATVLGELSRGLEPLLVLFSAAVA